MNALTGRRSEQGVFDRPAQSGKEVRAFGIASRSRGRGENMATFSDDLQRGTEIEVRTRYLASWAGGFEVEWVEGDRVGVRRRSDGDILPVAIASNDIRHPEAQSRRRR
jgi:hypothetical protein